MPSHDPCSASYCRWHCVFQASLGICTDNPGVFQGYPHPYPRKPYLCPRVWVSTGMGMGFAKTQGYTTRRWVCTQKMTNNLASSVQASIDTALQPCEDRKVIPNNSSSQQWACWCDGWWLYIGVINKTCWHGSQRWSCSWGLLTQTWWSMVADSMLELLMGLS